MPSKNRSRLGLAALAAASLLPLCLASAPARAENALWLRSPAISPDGKTVAFSYRGDLWTVPIAAPDPARFVTSTGACSTRRRTPT